VPNPFTLPAADGAKEEDPIRVRDAQQAKTWRSKKKPVAMTSSRSLVCS